MAAGAREIKAEGQTLVSRVAGTDLVIKVHPDGAIEITTVNIARTIAFWRGSRRIIVREEKI